MKNQLKYFVAGCFMGAVLLLFPAVSVQAAAIGGMPFVGTISGSQKTTEYIQKNAFEAKKPVVRQEADWVSASGISQVRPLGGKLFSEAKDFLNKGEKSISAVNEMSILCAPKGIAVMPDGTFLVTDTYSKRIWRMWDGKSEVFAGGETALGADGEPIGGYNDAKLLTSYFKEPWAIAPFLDGWAVSDTENNVVRIIREKDVQTLNGKTRENLKLSNRGGVAFVRPTGLASDKDGNLYISDTGNGAVRKISKDGMVVTVASGLDEPMGLCWKDDVLYIAETGANRIVKLEDGKVVTVAGNGEEALLDDTAEKAAFAAPQCVTVGDDGTIYVADTLNSAIRRIRNGKVNTLAVRDASVAGGGMVSPTGILQQGTKLYVCDAFARKLYVLEL